jgi:chemotaxis protein histidine kinase CheA
VHTLAGLGASRNDRFMAEPGEQDGLSAGEPNGDTPGEGRADRPGEAVAPPATTTGRRHSRWLWVSALLATAAAGLGIWALTLRSDRDDSQQELDTTTQQLTSTEQQLDTTKQQLTTAEQDVEDLESSEGSERKGAGLALVTAKVLYDEFTEQLGTTNDELAATQQDVEDANKAAAEAEKDAAAAKQDAADAGDASGKAEAEAKQAKAETQAAESKVRAAKGCAKAYIEAFGGLFEGDSASARAEAVRKDLKAVTLDCKDALAGT